MVKPRNVFQGRRAPVVQRVVPLAEGNRTPKRSMTTQVIRLNDTPVRVLFNNKFRVKAELRNQGPQRICLAETIYQVQLGDGVFLEGDNATQSVVTVETSSEVWATAVAEDVILVPSFDVLSWAPNDVSPILWESSVPVARVSVAETVFA